MSSTEHHQRDRECDEQNSSDDRTRFWRDEEHCSGSELDHYEDPDKDRIVETREDWNITPSLCDRFRSGSGEKHHCKNRGEKVARHHGSGNQNRQVGIAGGDVTCEF